MDLLTLYAALKKAGVSPGLIDAALAEAKSYSDSNLAVAKDYSDGNLAVEKMDKDTAVALLVNGLRQHQWQNEADALVCEEGTATLTNTQKFPFNDSLKSVALVKPQKNTKYVVIPELVSANGNAGEVTASEKQVNGFKLAFSGSASTATVKYIVIGGIIA